LLIVTLIALLFGSVFMLIRAGYKYINKYINDNLKPNDKVVSVFSETELNLIIEDELITAESPVLIIDEEIFLPFGVVKKYFDSTINWDEATSTVTITTEDKLIRMRTDNLDALVNNEPLKLNVPVIEQDGIIYIPIDVLKDLYEIEIMYQKTSNAVIIDYRNSIIQIAEPISEDAVVRMGPSIKEPIIRKLGTAPGDSEESRLRVFKEYKDWYKVRTSWGEIGYISKEHVVLTRMYMSKLPPEKKGTPPRWVPASGKVSLVFDQFRTKRPDLSKINMGESIDVVSPTWLDLMDGEGNIKNYSDKKYTEWAHQNNYKVWALVSSFDADITSKFLNDLNARDNFLRQLLSYSALYEFDGINIDFENIYLRDKEALTQFVREAAPLLREQGLIVSMDVGVPDGSDNYSKCYDLPELHKAVDYLVLMAYDQHWSTSPIAGSVAQYSWVEAKLRRTLEMVPPEKILLGMPLYIRLWEEKKAADGAISVSSGAYSMGYIQNLLQEKNASSAWDAESGQYYAEYEEDGALYRVWVEDGYSIDLKSSLVHKYKLAGAALWKRGFEMDGIWEIIYRNLKTLDSYFEWKEQAVWISTLN
jgi:spore germination protein YaaH